MAFAWSIGASATGWCVPEPHQLQRDVLAIYDSVMDPRVSDTTVHRMIEAPLNALGLNVRYHDIAKGFPEWNTDLRGVLAYFPPGYRLRDPRRFLAWANSVIDHGGRFVMMGEASFLENRRSEPTPVGEVDSMLRLIGTTFSGTVLAYPEPLVYDRIDRGIVGAERMPPTIVSRLAIMHAIEPEARSALRVARATGDADLVVIGTHGCYADESATLFDRYVGSRGKVSQWTINPDEFFRRCFGTDELLKPEPGIVEGKRVAFGFFDAGDEVAPGATLRRRGVSARELIGRELVDAFGEIPVSFAAPRERFQAVLTTLPTTVDPFVWELNDAGNGSWQLGSGALGQFLRNLVRSSADASETTPLPEPCTLVTDDADPHTQCAMARWDVDVQRTVTARSFLPPLANPLGIPYLPYPEERGYFEATRTPTGFRALEHSLEDFSSRAVGISFDYSVVQHEERLRSARTVARRLTAGSFVPTTPRAYAEMVRGAQTARFTQVGPTEWRITNRGALRTIRVDRAGLVLNHERSNGVLGVSSIEGALFIALDPAVVDPTISLETPRPAHVGTRVERRTNS